MSSPPKSLEETLPDACLRGKVVLITGGNSGLGLHAAESMAIRGAGEVIITARSAARGQEAVDGIKKKAADANISCMHLDLASMASVKKFAADFKPKFDRLDVCVFNAGVMLPPERTETADGLELQMGTNHIGHFLLAKELWGLIKGTQGSRVTICTSMAHAYTSGLDFSDLQWKNRAWPGQKDQNRWQVYADSKLMNLLMVLELKKRLAVKGSASPVVVASHPGWTATNLQRHNDDLIGMNATMAMPLEQGALPQIFSAVDGDATSGDYYGPDEGIKGWPSKGKASDSAYDEKMATQLWLESEKIIGGEFAV